MLDKAIDQETISRQTYHEKHRAEIEAGRAYRDIHSIHLYCKRHDETTVTL